MMTVTLAGDGEPTLENQKRLTKGIRSLMQWVRRNIKPQGAARNDFQGSGRSYVWVKECGESTGRLHAHFLWTMPFLRQPELSAAALRCGLGAVLDIRSTYALTGRGGFRSGTVGYITKYLTKMGGRLLNGGLPKNSRRFQTSNVAPYRPEVGWSWRPTPLGAVETPRFGTIYWLLGDRYLPVHLIPKSTTASRSPPDDGRECVPYHETGTLPGLGRIERS